MRKQVISAVALSLGFAATAVVAQTGPVNGDATAGAQLFYNHGCYGCHGYSGYGRKDLNNTGSPWLTNEEIFRAFLRALVPLVLMVLCWSWGEWLGYVTRRHPGSLVVAPEIRAERRTTRS